MNETENFRKLEAMLSSRGYYFSPQEKFQYWNDPLIYTLFNLIMELLEEKENDRRGTG